MKIKLLIFFLFQVFALTAQQQSLKPKLVLPIGHTAEVMSVTVSPNGKLALSADRKGYIKLWEIASGRELRSYGMHGKSKVSFQFSPKTAIDPEGGKYVISSGTDGRFILWELTTGDDIVNASNLNKTIGAAAYSPDGKFITAGSNKEVVIIRINPAENFLRLAGHTGNVTALVYSPDGSQIFSGGADGVIKIWNTQTGELIHSIDAHTKEILGLDLSPDGKRLLSAGKDDVIKIWDVPSKKELLQVIHPYLADANLGSKGNFILSTGKSELRKWSVQTGEMIFILRNGNSSIHAVALTPDNQLAIVAQGKELAIWDIGRQKQIKTLKGQVALLENAVIAANTDWAITSGSDGYFRKIDIATGKVLFLFKEKNTNKNTQLVLSPKTKADPDGGKYLISTVGEAIKFWSTTEGKVVKIFEGHSNEIRSILFDSDGSTLISMARGRDKTIRFWDVETDEVVKTITIPEDNKVIRLAISPDGEYLLTSYKKAVTYWEISTGEILWEVENRKPVDQISFSPKSKNDPNGGSQFLTKSYQGYALWDIASQSEKGYYLDDWHVLHAFNHGREISSMYDFEQFSKTRDLTKVNYGTIFNPVDADGNYALIGLDKREMITLNLKTGKKASSLVTFSNSTDWLQVTQDRYYYASKNAAKKLHYVVGITPYSFDQFDLQYNRPDIILARIGKAPSNLIAAYKSAYIKRLQKMGFSQSKVNKFVNGDFDRGFSAPEVQLAAGLGYIETKDKTFTFSFQAFEPNGIALDRLFVKVNGVPIYGVRGKSLAFSGLGKLDYTVQDLELSNGSNKIEITVLNDNGVASLTRQFEVNYIGSQAKPNLHIVTIGVSKYKDREMNLDYAAKDAQDLAALLENQSSKYNEVFTYGYLNEKATKANILGLKTKLESTHVDDVVVLFVAGHGLLDDNMDYYIAMNDVNFLAPAEKGLSYNSLEGLLDGIPARKKLMLLDACHSGEVDKDNTTASNQTSQQSVTGLNTAVKSRGFTKVKSSSLGLSNSFELMQELFNDLRNGTGAVVISAASGVEFSYESEEWNNGVFTFAILEGLQSGNADSNNDGEVQVSELRDYVMDQVTTLTNGRQHPTSRKENLEMDFVVW